MNKGTNDFFAFLRLIKDIFEKFKDIRFILKCVKMTKNENLPLFPLKYIEFLAHLYWKSPEFVIYVGFEAFSVQKKGVLLPNIATLNICFEVF